MFARLLGDIKGRLRRPAQILLCQPYFVGAQRRAVRFKTVLFVGRAITNVGAHQNQRRTLRFVARRARSIAARWLPSATERTCQPYASKRRARSSVKVRSVPAESVTWLSS